MRAVIIITYNNVACCMMYTGRVVWGETKKNEFIGFSHVTYSRKQVLFIAQKIKP